MKQFVKTTIGELLARGCNKDSDVYIMTDAEYSPEGDFGVYLYYLAVLSRLFEVGVDELLSSSRKMELIEPRVFAWKRLLEIDGWGQSWVAKVSGRGRSCVIQLVGKMNARMEKLKSDRLKQMYGAFCSVVDNNRELDYIQPFDVSFGKQTKKQTKTKRI